MNLFITTLLVMGLQASILAGITILFRRLFEKLPKGYIYVLWLVMLTRLLVPVIWESDYGVTPSPDRLAISATELLTPSANMVQNQTDTTPSMPGTNASDTTVSDTTTSNTPGSDETTNVMNNTTITTPNTTPALPFWQQTWFLPAICIVWGTGTAIILLVTGIQYLAMRRKLQFAIRLKENIWECETVSSPFVMGIIQPKIYLPLQLPEEERKYILAHEQMHIKHGDHVTRLLMTLATALHWWNPMVWVSMNLMKKDMEMLCDECATKEGDSLYRKAYSMTLVKYAAKSSGLSPVLSFGESNTESRVKHLMFLKKPKFYVNIALIFALCICLVGCVANGTVRDDSTDDTTDANNDYVNNDYKNPVQIPEETVTLTLYSDLSSYEGLQKGWFADVLLEKFNVKLDICSTLNGNAGNPFCGDYDLFVSGTYLGSDFQDALQQGALLNLSDADMKTYMPYISEHVTNSYICYPTEGTDNIYGIFTTTTISGDHEPTFYSWDLRFDYYEELGKPSINTLDDWVSVLEQIKTKHPTTEKGEETYAISYPGVISDGKLLGISGFVTGYYGYESNGLGYYDWKNDIYYGMLDRNADGSYGPYLEMLKLNQELYQKGLLDPESETQDWTIDAKYKNNQIFASVYDYLGSRDNAYMYPVVPKEARFINYQQTSHNRCVAISAQTEYPELTMAILDFLYSPEGMLTITYGPEGDCWYYDEDGYTHLTELGYDCISDIHETLMPDGSSFSHGYPQLLLTPYDKFSMNTRNGEPYFYTYWKSDASQPRNTTEAAWREWTGYDSVNSYMYNLDTYYTIPSITSLDFSKTELASTFDSVASIIASKSWEAIKASTDAEFDAIVEDMIKLATQAGYEECVEYSENYLKNQRTD